MAAAGAAAARLARGERDPAARGALRACALLYGAGSVPALQIMRGYAAAWGWDAAHAMFMLARQAGGGCDAALGGGAAGRTMAAANREFDQLASVTTALLNTVSLSWACLRVAPGSSWCLMWRGWRFCNRSIRNVIIY
jgi:hypothetical protein